MLIEHCSGIDVAWVRSSQPETVLANDKLRLAQHRHPHHSQALAESMGIETDWNCAISLRPLEDSSQPDPHRMKSDYADWDVKVPGDRVLNFRAVPFR